MRKLSVIVLLTLALLGFAVSQFVPVNYDSIFITRSNGKYYDLVKKSGLIKILAVDLGLEPMIQGLMASYTAQYGLTIKDIDDLLRGDLLAVQSGENVFLALGPSASASKFVKVVTSFLGQEFFVDHKNNYLLISTSKELLDQCSKGGGSIPKEVMDYFKDEKIWAISYASKLLVGEAVFSSKGFVSVSNDQIYSEQILLPQNDAAKQTLKQLSSSGNFELAKDKNLAGEVFAFVNMSDSKATDILFQTSGNISQVSEFGKMFGLDSKEFFDKFQKLLKKFTGKAVMSVQLAEAVESLFSSDQESGLDAKTYGALSMKTNLQELKGILGGEIKSAGNVQYLDTDGLYLTIDGSLVKFYSVPPHEYKVGRSSLDKAINLFKPNEMSLFVFVDFDPILDKLLGITTGSIFVLFQNVENNLLKTIWYLK